MTDTLAVSAVKRIFKYLPVCYAAAARQDHQKQAAVEADHREAVTEAESEYREAGTEAGKLAVAEANGCEAAISAEEARMQMSLAALEAGIAFNNASVTVIHGMSRPIGALFHVPHGISNAMLLCTCFAYVYREAADRFADLGRAMGAAGGEDTDLEAAEKFIRACRELCEFCRIPTPEEYGIDREEFLEKIPKMTRDALASGSPANTRKLLSEEDISVIYRSLLN